MLPDRVSNPGPLTYESGALPTALRRPMTTLKYINIWIPKRINFPFVPNGKLMVLRGLSI